MYMQEPVDILLNDMITLVNKKIAAWGFSADLR